MKRLSAFKAGEWEHFELQHFDYSPKCRIKHTIKLKLLTIIKNNEQN